MQAELQAGSSAEGIRSRQREIYSLALCACLSPACCPCCCPYRASLCPRRDCGSVLLVATARPCLLTASYVSLSPSLLPRTAALAVVWPLCHRCSRQSWCALPVRLSLMRSSIHSTALLFSLPRRPSLPLYLCLSLAVSVHLCLCLCLSVCPCLSVSDRTCWRGQIPAPAAEKRCTCGWTAPRSGRRGNFETAQPGAQRGEPQTTALPPPAHMSLRSTEISVWE